MARQNTRSRRNPKASEKRRGKRPPKHSSPSVEATQQSDDEADGLNITYDKFHPEWNYTTSPRPKK